MKFAYILCSIFTIGTAHLEQIGLPVYVPPSEDVLVNKYFQNGDNDTSQNDARSIAENLYNAIAQTDAVDKNNVETTSNSSNAVSDVVWTGLLKNLLRNSYETTTYRYPTATWSAEQHEKLKEYRRSQFRKMPKIFVMKPSLLLKPVLPVPEDRQRVTVKPKRGKVKWKDSRLKTKGKEDADKFLEQSLFKYLVSSNLIENIGNISVETFSEVLRNITRQKADRRQVWPYDENKELRIKFRDEVFMRRKAENSSRANFLEKQFQKRLEKMKDYFNAKNKEKNRSGFESTLQKSEAFVEGVDAVTTTPVPSPSPSPPPTPINYIDYEKEQTTIWSQFNETSYEPNTTDPIIITAPPQEFDITERSTNAVKSDFEELKLSVAETVYYKKRPVPRTYSYEEEESGVIPGIPEVDYPMYSSPPSTGFKCPKNIGEQPKMMADVQTRCQVFYICTGDGPAAAMLCPNGTMFNENVRVCDWWYNVDC